MTNKLKTINSKGLTDFDQQFVNQYLMNGGNARAAFLVCKPAYSPTAASSASSKLMKKPEVQSYLELRRAQLLDKENIELSFLVQNLKKIVEDVNAEEIERDVNGNIKSKPDRMSALKAIETLAKLGGFYDKKSTVNIQSTGSIKISFGDWNPALNPVDITPIGTEDSSESIDYEDLTEEDNEQEDV